MNEEENMREIKFRAWDKGTDSWHIFTPTTSVMCDPIDRYILDSPDGLIVWEQFTGLLDKNGKEIYEGDIIYSPYRGWKMIVKIGESKCIGCGVELSGVMVEYLNVGIKSEPFMYKSGCYDYEIIGNIHENHELL